MGTRVIGYRRSMVHSIKLLAQYTPILSEAEWQFELHLIYGSGEQNHNLLSLQDNT
jgi:hypothetical protein